MERKRVELWSSGGGVQSTAIAVLILQGKLPKPDLAVIADTEREKSSTWRYMQAYTQPALAQIGVEIRRIKKSQWAAPDLVNEGGDTLLMPMFTTRNGEVGKLPTYCSDRWKVAPVHRFASDQFPKSQFRVWMGMSYDEPRRIKPSLKAKWLNWYPLYDMRITRGQCIDLVQAYGWPIPQQSSCWMCPNRRAQQWKEMSVENPDEFLKAVILEEEIHEKHDDEMFLHESGVPLAQAVLMTPPKEPTLFDTERCDSGQCFV